MRIRTLSVAAAAFAAAQLLAACGDNSPQSADGATNAGDPGTAAATNSGSLADTGRDTGTGGDIGGAGDLSANATASTTGAIPDPGSAAASNSGSAGGGGGSAR